MARGTQTSTVVLLDLDSDDAAMCGRPDRKAPRERYVLSAAGEHEVRVAMAPADAERLVAALSAWLATVAPDPDENAAAAVAAEGLAA